MFVFGWQKYDKLTTFKNKKHLGKNKTFLNYITPFLHTKTISRKQSL